MISDGEGLWRYERKYVTDRLGMEELEDYVLSHPGLFRQIYYPRQVMSIYFDTEELDYYQQNELGVQQRRKVRVRWYEYKGQSSVMQIEVKIREGEVMKKVKFLLSKRVAEVDLDEVSKLVEKKLMGLVEEVDLLKPVVVVGYERRYFLSESLRVRITLDADLRFQTTGDWQAGRITSELGLKVLECKYGVESDFEFVRVAERLPLRISKSSKYMMGMQQCY